MRVAGEGKKLGLKDVGGVARVVAEHLPPPLPVPHDDVEVVRAGGQPEMGENVDCSTNGCVNSPMARGTNKRAQESNTFQK